MTDNIFRQNAINHLQSIDDVEPELIIIKTSWWLWLIALLSLLIGISIWMLFGTINLQVVAQGIIVTNKQLIEAETNIMQEKKDNLDYVRELYDMYLKKQLLFRKHYITRVDLIKSREEYLRAMQMMTENNNNYSISNQKVTSPLLALVFINYQQGKKIKPGMYSYILPTTQSVYENGYITGNIASVSPFPITKKIATTYLQNSNLTDSFFAQGSPFIGFIQLPSATQFQAGETIIANIRYLSCTPAQLLIKSQHCAT